jgi:hypothetical protein
MAAFAFFGLPTVDLARQLIAGYEAVVARFRPQCREWRVSEPDINGRPLALDIFYRCTAYNGDWAEDVESYYRGRLVSAPLDRAKVDADATRNTSRALALRALPGLREAVAREGTP